ncbi:flagellar biosynthetic protein FliR [Pararobbsia silviterrae]|uniref:Flagellar biosynthetic protein FliR n=1 Tax=Pararobbsia silviterrae TaxID=1792498 RepID=A0A494X3T4_9BURK|nr:flagellar biosynthetic protein FliR [Pararobbsia silviterrae]RKP45355.1 flagellar biosynthetic protein FliR [Pararobbsia silviterrae]
MITFTYAQLMAWLAAFIWPATRLLALFATAPFFNHASIPVMVKVGISLLITIIIAPSLPALPAIGVTTPIGLLILAEQILIGAAIGFTIQIVFTAIEAAADMAGLQMGLGFAQLLTGSTDGSTDVLSRLMNLVSILAFLSIDGHLQVLGTLLDSFYRIPISATPIAALGLHTVAAWGETIFSAGLLLSLPVIIALLIVNLSLGVLNRAAPQIGVFQVGFPLTLSVGLLMLQWMTPNLMPFFARLFSAAMDAVVRVVGGLG